MYSFPECLEIINKEIDRLTFEKEKPAELYEPVRYILGLGGKRIRPALMLMACNLYNDSVEDAIAPAMAIEIFHNFTLIHDDIMDNAPLRRNKPTVHEKWNENVAILSGDAMQIIAYRFLCLGKPQYLLKLMDIFNQTAIEICEGQQFDMNFAKRTEVTLDEYLRMIELKTSVLLAASLKMGAISGGATEEEAQKLYEFGRNLGLAFQIKDDYLDTYANQDNFGKTIGGDIAENKKTFLLIKALELSKGEQNNILMRAISNQIADSEIKFELVRKVYDELGIPEITRRKIEEYSSTAFSFLNALNVIESKKEYLREVAQNLMTRDK